MEPHVGIAGSSSFHWCEMDPVPKFCLQSLVGSRALELESALGSSFLPFNATLLAAPSHHEYQLVCLPASLEHAGWYFALLLFVVGAVFTALHCCIQQYYRTVHSKQLVERNSESRSGSSQVQGSRGPVGGAPRARAAPGTGAVARVCHWHLDKCGAPCAGPRARELHLEQVRGPVCATGAWTNAGAPCAGAAP